MSQRAGLLIVDYGNLIIANMNGYSYLGTYLLLGYSNCIALMCVDRVYN